MTGIGAFTLNKIWAPKYIEIIQRQAQENQINKSSSQVGFIRICLVLKGTSNVLHFLIHLQR